MINEISSISMEHNINSNDLYELLLTRRDRLSYDTTKEIRSKLNKVNVDDINIDFNTWN